MMPRLVRTGLRRGVMGGSRRWLVVGAVAGLVQLARRAANRPPEIVWSGVLDPGESLTIDVREPDDPR